MLVILYLNWLWKLRDRWTMLLCWSGYCRIKRILSIIAMHRCYCFKQPRVYRLTQDVSDLQLQHPALHQELDVFHNLIATHTQSKLVASKELTETASGLQQRLLKLTLRLLLLIYLIIFWIIQAQVFVD